jgi:hypothetical protein
MPTNEPTNDQKHNERIWELIEKIGAVGRGNATQLVIIEERSALQ